MLTSFFGKSSPLNYLLLSVFIAIAIIVAIFTSESTEFSIENILEFAFVIVASVFSMLLLDFIIRKNQLTQGNTFAIFLYSCYLIALVGVFFEPKIIAANILVLLAFRRTFSLTSEKNTEKKILDASLYICFASLFYVPSIAFLIFLFIAILRTKGLQYKLLMIPIVGVVGAFILSTTYFLLTANSFLWMKSWFKMPSFDFSAYGSLTVLIPVTIFISILLWSGAHKLIKFTSLSKKEKPKSFLLLNILLICIVVILGSHQKTGAEVLFLLAPLAILATNYIEYTKTENRTNSMTTFWFKELLLWVTLLIPVLVLLNH